MKQKEHSCFATLVGNRTASATSAVTDSASSAGADAETLDAAVAAAAVVAAAVVAAASVAAVSISPGLTKAAGIDETGADEENAGDSCDNLASTSPSAPASADTATFAPSSALAPAAAAAVSAAAADAFSKAHPGLLFSPESPVDIVHPFSKYHLARRLDRGVNGAVYGPYAASIAPTAGRANAGGDATGDTRAAACAPSPATDVVVSVEEGAAFARLPGAGTATVSKSPQSSISRSVASLERAAAAPLPPPLPDCSAAPSAAGGLSASPPCSGVSGLSCTAGKNISSPSVGLSVGFESPQRLLGDRGDSAPAPAPTPSIHAVFPTGSSGMTGTPPSTLASAAALCWR